MTIIRNYMEDCVKDMLDTVLRGIKCCDCEKCRMDMFAIAMNSLPPKYVATQKGELYTKIASLQQQFEVDIISAITKASVIVAMNPRHDSDEE